MHAKAMLIALLTAAGAAAAVAQELPPPTTAEAQPEQAREHSPDAVAALRAATRAVEEGFSAQVSTYAQGNALLETTFPKGEGRWVQGPLGEDNPLSVRYTGAGKVMTQNEPVDFDILFQEDRVTWVDHLAKTYNVETLRGRKGGEAYMLASSAWSQVSDLAHGFEDAMSAFKLETREPAEVDGVMCTVVAVQEKPDVDPVLWYFGREDNLPRRSEIVLPSQEFGGSIRVDFTDVEAGADAIADVDWEIPAPAGYQQKVARMFQERAPADETEVRTPLPKPAPGAPDWEVPDSEGKLVSPGSLRGKVAVLYFWGTWAPSCKKATPEVAELATDYEDKPVEVISMAFREGSPDDVVREARAQGQTWRQVPQADDAVKVLGVRIAPSVIVLGQQGELLFRSGRPQGEDYDALFEEVRAIIDRALAGGGAGGEQQHDGPAAKGAQREVAPAEATPIRRPQRGGG